MSIFNVAGLHLAPDNRIDLWSLFRRLDQSDWFYWTFRSRYQVEIDWVYLFLGFL